jgi:hypothetical protein
MIIVYRKMTETDKRKMEKEMLAKALAFFKAKPRRKFCIAGVDEVGDRIVKIRRGYEKEDIKAGIAPL